MFKIRDALLLKDVNLKVDGLDVCLRRPSALDMVSAVQAAKDMGDDFAAWLVLNHLKEDGVPVFTTIDEVKACDGLLVFAIADEVQKLYGEGGN